MAESSTNKVELLHSVTFQATEEPQGGSPSITCHALHVEKRILFAGRSDGTIAFWKRRPAQSVESRPTLLRGHSGAVRCLLLVLDAGCGHDNFLLMSGSADRTVKVWDPTVRELEKSCVQTLRGHGGTVTALIYHAGVLFTASTDRTIRLWRADEGRELLLYPWFSPVQTLNDIDCWINAMALQMGDGAALYVGDEEGTLSIYKVNFGSAASPGATPAKGGQSIGLQRWRRQQGAHTLGITALLLVPQEHSIASASYDQTVRVFDTLSGTALLTIENGRKCCYTALHWDARHAELILGDEAGHVYFWSLAAERCLKCERLQLAGRGVGAVRSLSVRGDELLASAGASVGAWLVVRDVKYMETRGHTAAVISLIAVDPPNGGGDGRATSALSAAGDADEPLQQEGGQSLIYSAGLDGTVRAWEPYDMTCLTVLHEERSEISCMHWSPICDFLLTGHDDGTIRMWNVDSGSTVTLSGHTNTVCCLGLASRGSVQLMFSTGFDGCVGVWDVTKRQHAMPRLELMFKAHPEEALVLQVCAHLNCFATAGNHGDVHVWSIKNFELQAKLQGHVEAVTCMALDGNFLFSGCEDGTVRMWDLHSHFSVGQLEVHSAAVEGMLIIPSSGWLVTCSSDHTVRVWDYSAGLELKTWRYPESFRCVCHRKHSHHVLAGTEEHHIVSFPLAEVEDAVRERREAEALALVREEEERQRALREAEEAAAAAATAAAAAEAAAAAAAESDDDE